MSVISSDAAAAAVKRASCDLTATNVTAKCCPAR